MYKQKMQKHLLLWILLFLCLGLNAQVKFIATAPEKVTKGEQFRLVYKLQGGESDNINFPSSIKGFEIVSGPNKSIESNTLVTNDNTTTEYLELYVYTLIAKSEGTFTLPIATIKVGGKRITTLNSVHIKVLPLPTQSSLEEEK